MIGGWGRYPLSGGVLLDADRPELAQRLVRQWDSLIPRGNGRAYGDAALNDRAMLSLLRADHILAFDAQAGEITVEAGVILADLLPFLVAHGFFVPVTPGTAQVTVGGMAAADVHGKNHHVHGSFGRYVTALGLILADGSEVRCAPPDELFWATIGGMGLTGAIVWVQFRLLPVPGGMIRQTTIKTRTLEETIAACQHSARATYSVAWIDCLAGGRGLVYEGEHAAGHAPARGQGRRVPFNIPEFSLNRASISIFNQLYYSKHRAGEALVDYWRFFYPLDGLADWNRLYGRRGLVQYQCALPTEASESGLKLLLGEIAKQGLGSFLAVLKLCGDEGQGLMSFPMPGFSLALDFPARPEIFALMDRLDEITLEHGGRLYLAKDARAKPRMLRHYQRRETFRSIRGRIDPRGRFASLMSRRLEL